MRAIGATAPRLNVRSRRTQLALFAAVAAVTALVAVEVHRHSQTDDAQVNASAAALSPVLTGLGSPQPFVTSHPSCDDDPPCTSTARTWSQLSRRLTFDELDQAMPAWANRNHLNGKTQWSCGPHTDLFGDTGGGCQAAFTGHQPDQTVFVVARFTNPTSVMFDPPQTGYNVLPQPMPALSGQPLASLSIQVVQKSSAH